MPSWINHLTKFVFGLGSQESCVQKQVGYMFKNISKNRRELALLVIGGFSVVALAGLGASSSVASGLAFAVIGNVIADLIFAAISER